MIECPKCQCTTLAQSENSDILQCVNCGHEWKHMSAGTTYCGICFADFEGGKCPNGCEVTQHQDGTKTQNLEDPTKGVELGTVVEDPVDPKLQPAAAKIKPDDDEEEEDDDDGE